MPPRCIVDIKQVYGNETVYPVCENAKLFAQLAGTRTLTRSALSVIKQLGYDIQVSHSAVIAKACELNGSPA